MDSCSGHVIGEVVGRAIRRVSDKKLWLPPVFVVATRLTDLELAKFLSDQPTTADQVTIITFL